MSPARVIKNTNCQQNGGCCVESTEHPKWISPSNSSPSPSSSERRSLPVIIRCVARIRLRVRVSRAQTRRNGPLSLIGPPCLLSPYRFCQGILTVRAGGGREGGERRKGGGQGRGVEGSCRRLFAMFPATYLYTHFGISHRKRQDAYKKCMHSTKQDRCIFR